MSRGAAKNVLAEKGFELKVWSYKAHFVPVFVDIFLDQRGGRLLNWIPARRGVSVTAL
jgi:hypothetical protein